MICGSKQGIEAADGLDWTLLLIQSIGQLQLGRSIVRRELQQLAVKPFGFWPGLGFFEVPRGLPDGLNSPHLLK